jgi:integrase
VRAPVFREAAARWASGAEIGSVRTRSGDRYRPSTLRGYRHSLDDRLLPTLGHLRLSDITKGALYKLVRAMLADGLAPASVRNALLPMRVIFRDAVAAELVTSNPCDGLALPAVRSGRDRVVQPPDVARQIATLPERDQPLWAVAIYAGLRCGELMALRWDDVDLGRRVVRVVRAYDPIARVTGEPKSRAGLRVVPIPAVLADQLGAHLGRAHPERQPLVFARSSLAGRRRLPDGEFNAGAVIKRAKLAWDAHGVRPVTLHDCRHTYASMLIAAGETAKGVQTYLGHSSITVTFDRYGHLFAAAERESAARLQAYLDGVVVGSVAADNAATEEQPSENVGGNV